MNKKLFPLSSKYDSKWIKKNSLLHNTLLYTESLCNIITFKKNMHILDLGCGKAISSIFIANEFDVQVWALDREIPPSENYEIICEMKCEDKVFPIKSDARKLPFAYNFFDIIISIDSFPYYGTDDWYISYLSQFIKPGGYIAITDWCFSREFENIADVPEFLKKCYQDIGFHSMHSIKWWKNHFEKLGLIKINNAEILPENDYLLDDFIKSFENLESEKIIVDALKEDKDNFISTFRIVGQRTMKQPYFDDFTDKRNF